MRKGEDALWWKLEGKYSKPAGLRKALLWGRKSSFRQIVFHDSQRHTEKSCIENKQENGELLGSSVRVGRYRKGRLIDCHKKASAEATEEVLSPRPDAELRNGKIPDKNTC